MSKNGERILAAVADYWAAHGYAPSYRDIAEGAGIVTTSVVAYHLIKLRDQGLVDFEFGTPRSVRLVEAVQA